jgi:hypothetical protein
MSAQRKRNRFLNAKRDGTSYKMKPEGESLHGNPQEQGQWEYRPGMNENNPKVALTNEQRETLAGTLNILAEALRERRELRVRDFQDLADEVRHFQQSPNPLDRGRMVYVDEIP